MPQTPLLLSEIFARVPFAKVEPIRISLGALAKSLIVTVPELCPLVREGYLRKRSEENLLTAKTLVDAPPEAAITWMRSWFLPATAKPLFSVDNLAELLGVPAREVLPIAAAHDLPCQRDPALGFVFSAWATRTLLLRVAKGQNAQATRFDRIAILWRLMEEDPVEAAAPPKFDSELEKELARVAQLEEPARGLRTVEIIESLQDARVLAESAIRAGASRARATEFGSDPDSASPA